MDEFTPEALLEQLRQLDGQPQIEAKRASEIGKSICRRFVPLLTSLDWAAVTCC